MTSCPSLARLLLALVLCVANGALLGVVAQSDACSSYTTCTACQLYSTNVMVDGTKEFISCLWCAVGTVGTCLSLGNTTSDASLPWYVASVPDSSPCAYSQSSYHRRVYADYTCPAETENDSGKITVTFERTKGDASTATTVETGQDPKKINSLSIIIAAILAAAVVIAEIGWLHYRHNVAPGAAESKIPATMREDAKFEEVAGSSPTAASPPPEPSEPAEALGSPRANAAAQASAAAATKKEVGKGTKLANRIAPIKFLAVYPVKVIITVVLAYQGYTSVAIKSIPCEPTIRPGCDEPASIMKYAPTVFVLSIIGLVATAGIHFFGLRQLDKVGKYPVGHPFRDHLLKIAAMASSFPDMYVLFIARNCKASIVLAASGALTLLDAVWSLIYIFFAWQDLTAPLLGALRFMLIIKFITGLMSLKDIVWFGIKLWLTAGSNMKCVRQGDTWTCKDESSTDERCGPAEVLDEAWLKLQYDAWNFDRANPRFVDQWRELILEKRKREAAGSSKA